MALGTKPISFSLFVFVPLPNTLYDQAFDQGHSIIPAVQLAVEQIERTDILPSHINLNIVVKESGCDKTSQTVISLVSSLREYVRRENIPIAIIGPACSEATLFVIDTLKKALSLPVLYSGTSPVLSETAEETPSAFGMLSSADVLIDTLIRIAVQEKWDWKNIAVLYDDTRDNFRRTYDTFISKLNSSQQLGYASRIALPQIPIDEIIARNIRIVVVLSSKEPARRFVCRVRQKRDDFAFPIHQLIFLERSLNDFLGDGEGNPKFTRSSEECSEEIMTKGLEGSIFLNQALDSVDPEMVSVSNYTVGQIKELYKSALLERGKALNMTLPESSFAYAYYDAVWTFALGFRIGLNSTTPTLKTINAAILNNVSFQGVSSWIDFSNRHHVTNPISILQAKEGIAMERGRQNRSNLTYTPQTFISDKFTTENVIPHPAIVAFGFFFAIVLLLLTVIMQIMTIVYRDYPSLKATSAQLNHFIYLGCYLFMGALLVNTFRVIVPSANGSVLCSMNIYSSILGSCFIFSTILMKSWRIYRIFGHVFTTSRSHHCSLHIAALTTIILSLALITALLCIPALVLTPFGVKTIKTYDISQWIPVEKINTECDIETFRYVIIPLLFLLCIKYVAVGLATLNRHIKRKHFKTTKQIVALIYMLTVIWSIGAPLLALFYYLDFSVNITYAFYSSLLVTTVILCQAMLIIPSLTPVLTRRDKGTKRLSSGSIVNNKFCV